MREEEAEEAEGLYLRIEGGEAGCPPCLSPTRRLSKGETTPREDEVVALLLLVVVEVEKEFFHHYKNDLKRHAHTLSGDAGECSRF